MRRAIVAAVIVRSAIARGWSIPLSEAQARGGARQEIRRSVLDGAKAREETAATETLGRPGGGGAGAQEWGSARYWQARQWSGVWLRSGDGYPATCRRRSSQPGSCCATADLSVPPWSCTPWTSTVART